MTSVKNSKYSSTGGYFQQGTIPAILDAAADDVLRKYVDESDIPGSWAARAAIATTDIVDEELRELHGKPPTQKSAIETIKRVNLYTNPMTSAAYTAYMTSGIQLGGGDRGPSRWMLVVAVVIVVVGVIILVNMYPNEDFKCSTGTPAAIRFFPREALGGNSGNKSNVTPTARTKNTA